MADRVVPNFRLTIEAFLHLVPNYWHYLLIFQGGERQKALEPGTFKKHQKCQKIV